jgi:hypothetical protein
MLGSKAGPRTPPLLPVRPGSPSSSKHYVAGPSPISFDEWLHLVIFLICRLQDNPEVGSTVFPIVLV